MPRVLDVLTTGVVYGDLCGRIVRGFSASQVKHWAFQNWDAIDWPRIARNESTPLLVISSLADFPAGKAVRPPKMGRRERRFLVFRGGLPAEAVPPRLSRLGVRDERRLHLVTPEDRDTVEAIVRRAIRGLANPRGEWIVDAWWEGSEFVVLSPAFERLRVPDDKLVRLIGNDVERAGTYDVDPDGAFVYWPHADVHLGWVQFLRMVNPAAAFAAHVERDKFDARYGTAIRALREKRGLRQIDIPGLTARQVGRIERGNSQATPKALTKLAEAHEMGFNDYLGALAEQLR